MRTPLIAGNWKMHKGVAETTAYLESLLAEELPPSVDILCCPPSVALPAAAMITTAKAQGCSNPSRDERTSAAALAN